MEESKFPFHEKLQTAFAAYLLKVKGAMDSHAEFVLPRYWSTSTTSQIMKMSVEYHAEHRLVPSDPVLRELIRETYPDVNNPDDVRRRNALEEKLNEINETPLTDQEYISTKIRDFARHNALKEFVYKAYENLKEGEFDPTLPDQARAVLSVGTTTNEMGQDWVAASDRRVKENTSPDINPRISTGLPHLDGAIDGGLQGGELGIFLALPKHFKSGTMLNMAYAAMRQSVGVNVAYVTLELSENLVGMRFDIRTTLMTKEEIKSDPDYFTEILKERQDIVFPPNQKLMIKEFKSKTASCDTIRSYLDRLYHQHDVKIGMLIVDYLDLLKSTKKRDKDYLEATDTCEELRSVASKSEYNIPVWTACRATREAVGRKIINMSAMSKSFERIGICDICIALCMTEEEKLKGDLRMYMAATRNDAGDKVINCKVDYTKMLLTSVGVSDPEFEEDGESSYRYKSRGRRDQDDGDDPPPPDVPRSKKGRKSDLSDEETNQRRQYGGRRT